MRIIILHVVLPTALTDFVNGLFSCLHSRCRARYFVPRRRMGAGRRWVRRPGDRTRRRRLNKLSCAGWVPHDRGFVLGLPHSKDERRSGDRLITAREGSPTPALPPALRTGYVMSSGSSSGSSCDGGWHLIRPEPAARGGQSPR